MRTRSLIVEGTTYYSEYRKCGRVGCRCMGANGDLHGPYWYARNANQDITYIGKTLPEDVEDAHQRLALARVDIEAARRALLEQAEALRRLSVSDSLTDRQRGMIEDLGFGWCLVLRPVDVGAQDGRG
jgi:hypothetical protein